MGAGHGDQQATAYTAGDNRPRKERCHTQSTRNGNTEQNAEYRRHGKTHGRKV